MKRAAIALYVLLVLGGLYCTGCTTFEGKVALKGNEPHTFLVLITNKAEYTIVGRLSSEIKRHYQQKRIRVKGTIVKKRQGPLKPAELEVMEVLAVLETQP
jgi:hypothetical protein